MLAKVEAAPNTTPPSHGDTAVASVLAARITAITPSQARPYIVNAPMLRMQATKLKNRLLTGGTPCQCTSAGACQKASDTGRYSTALASSSMRNSGDSATSVGL